MTSHGPGIIDGLNDAIAYAKLERLKATNKDLLAALEELVQFCADATEYEALHPFEFQSALNARAAIKLAKGARL